MRATQCTAVRSPPVTATSWESMVRANPSSWRSNGVPPILQRLLRLSCLGEQGGFKASWPENVLSWSVYASFLLLPFPSFNHIWFVQNNWVNHYKGNLWFLFHPILSEINPFSLSHHPQILIYSMMVLFRMSETTFAIACHWHKLQWQWWW